MKKTILILSISLFFTGCATTNLFLKPGSTVDEINIKYKYSIDNGDSVATMLSNQLNDYILNYNESEENRKFILVRNDTASVRFLSIDVEKVEYVESSKQFTSTIISLVGLGAFAYTLANNDKTGFTIFWYWFPQFSITSVLKLSNDLNDRNNVVIKTVGSFHAFRDIEGQRKELCNDFNYLLLTTIRRLEVSIRK